MEDQKPIFCTCGARLIEDKREDGHDPYTGVQLYRITMKCPSYGKWFAGTHDLWELNDDTWARRFEGDV